MSASTTEVPVIDLAPARDGDVLVECLASQGAARHAPVRAGACRDLKYAKTGLAGAAVGPAA